MNVVLPRVELLETLIESDVMFPIVDDNTLNVFVTYKLEVVMTLICKLELEAERFPFIFRSEVIVIFPVVMSVALILFVVIFEVEILTTL